MKTNDNKLSVIELFTIFAKIGLFSIGGGPVIIAHLTDEFVNKRKILSQDEFLEIIAIGESTPGPIAVNAATYIGYKYGKIKGSLFATLGIILPSFVIMLIISFFFRDLLEIPLIKYGFEGIKCGVIFLIFRAGIKMIKGMNKSPLAIFLFISVMIVEVLLNIFVKSFSSIFLILIGAVLGLIFNGILKAKNEGVNK